MILVALKLVLLATIYFSFFGGDHRPELNDTQVADRLLSVTQSH